MPHALTSLPHRSMLPPPPTEFVARFAVEVEVERHLVRYVMAGFFDAVSVAAVKACQAEAMRQLRCPAYRHVTILDIIGCRIQTQAVLGQFAAMLDDPRYRARALAVVVGGSLARMQVTRMLDRSEVAFFATVADAEAWLFPADAASPRADRRSD